MKKSVLFGLVVALALAVLGVVLYLRGKNEPVSGTDGAKGASVIAEGRREKPKLSSKSSRRRAEQAAKKAAQSAAAESAADAEAAAEEAEEAEEEEEDDDTEYTPEEQALADRIEEALDREDLKLARECAAEAFSCANVDIRRDMVSTLGWFGAKAIAELTPFMADRDEDVSEDAKNEWAMGISDIEDEDEKIQAIELALMSLSDEDTLDDVASEYIGLDEKRSVESILRVVESGASANGVGKAKEMYEFVTGDEFEGRAAAEKWIAEEYEPDEE